MKIFRFVNFSLYLSTHFFLWIVVIVVLFTLSFAYQGLYSIATVLGGVLWGVLVVDVALLYLTNKGIEAERVCKEKFSNGDDNEIKISLKNLYNFPVRLHILDEIPIEYQIRDFYLKSYLSPSEAKTLTYTLRPVRRGENIFGALNVYARTGIGLAVRRFRFASQQSIKVYPSYIQMRKYEIVAISNRLTEFGIKKVRKLGHNMEFEQVKEYVIGDDVRTINWKATARKGSLMVNQYQDEKSQQIFSVIDKGRLMKMPFEGMTLLDYAINASLVLSNTALLKQDKAGLITFDQEIGTFLPALRSHSQMDTILEALYKQSTNFKEADFANLYVHIQKRISHRSFLLLFTNFETVQGLQRQLPYLRKLSTTHLLIVVIFENTELKTLIETPTFQTEQIYMQTIAEKFVFEKRLIIKELQRYGIQSMLTTPQNLTIHTLNKYLEMKSRGLI